MLNPYLVLFGWLLLTLMSTQAQMGTERPFFLTLTQNSGKMPAGWDRLTTPCQRAVCPSAGGHLPPLTEELLWTHSWALFLSAWELEWWRLTAAVSGALPAESENIIKSYKGPMTCRHHPRQNPAGAGSLWLGIAFREGKFSVICFTNLWSIKLRQNCFIGSLPARRYLAIAL